MVNLLKLI